MKKWVKVLLIVVVIGILGAAGVVYYVYNRPHRDVAKEKGVQLSAQALYDAFRTNEAEAYEKYVNKKVAVEVTGQVGEVSTNMDGNVVVTFKTNDPLAVINCTFKENPGSLQPGQTITFRGICTGYFPDDNVAVNEGILVK
jgi:Tfp pilus assembly protein PilV